MADASSHDTAQSRGIFFHDHLGDRPLEVVPRREPTPRRRPKSEQTLAAILKVSLEIALRKGVFNLTLGDVAEALSISKSGVFLRAGSLEALQLLVIKEHERIFMASVFEPSINKPRGMPRLESLVRLWMSEGMAMSSLISSHYAACEFDPQAPSNGPRDYLIDIMRRWRLTLRTAIQQSVDEGHLKADTDPYQMCFELFGLMSAVIYDTRMVKDPEALRRGLAAFERLLKSYKA